MLLCQWSVNGMRKCTAGGPPFGKQFVNSQRCAVADHGSAPLKAPKPTTRSSLTAASSCPKLRPASTIESLSPGESPTVNALDRIAQEGNSRSQQYLAKPSLFARTFAKIEHEDWPSSGLDDRAGTEVHPTRARRVAKKPEVQFGRPGSSTNWTRESM